MRTVWLALFCLIGLATTVVLKIGMSPYASADVSRGLPYVTPGPKLQNGPLTKADKLEVSYTNEAAPEVKSVKSISIVLPTTEPKRLSKKIERIASRHWHDPLSVPAAAQPATRRKASNTSTNRSPIVTAHAPKS